MGRVVLLVFSLLATFLVAQCEDPYVYHTWEVNYETLSPLGVPQKVITINGSFPGPTINCTSNNNIVVNIFNNLEEPLLFTWNGIQQRKNSWQEGTLGTNCPIQPGTNFTFHFQVKDQIGSYYYYPTTHLHRAAGGFGLISIHSRDLIPVPFDTPEDDFRLFVGDWYAKSLDEMKSTLDAGKSLGRPSGLLINGKNGNDNVPMFTVKPGKTYRYRICNVGVKDSINVRFQSHSMKLVELEGSHTMQNTYDSLDAHLGQCFSVLVTADQAPQDYLVVASTRFAKKKEFTTTALLRYEGGAQGPPPAALPAPPVAGPAWSINQFRSFRWNLTASAARPNPQGSYHYGKIDITRTIKLAIAPSVMVGGKRRFAVNGVSHVDNTETPLKLAEYYGMADKVFQYNLMKDEPSPDAAAEVIVAPNVINGTFRNFVEIIFENHDKSIQTWHLSGYSFFAVGVAPGRWSQDSRKQYNLIDALSRNTIQVYPNSWAAVMTTLDNAGMWSLRSNALERQYLGEQLYISVLSPGKSLRDEYNIFPETLVCGLVKDLPKPAPYSGT